MPVEKLRNLTSKTKVNKNSQLFANTSYNLMGQLAPVLSAVVAIPILIHYLGTQRFGLLTMAWMAIGYLSFFDFGVGRATTKFVAEYIADGTLDKIPQLVADSVKLLMMMGIAFGVVIALLASWIAVSLLNIPQVLAKEATTTFYIIAISLPLVLGATATRGYLEGCQRFLIVNVIRVPSGVSLVAAPLLVLPFTKNVAYLVASLAISRAVIFVAYAYYTFLGIKGARFSSKRTNSRNFKKLFKFGGLVALTNILGSLMSMAYLDRFIISHMLGIGALTYYVTPFDVITKILIIPSSLIGVLFPAFVIRKNETNSLVPLYYRAIRYVFMLTLPLILLVMLYGYQALSLWLGAEFAKQSFLILDFFAIGVLANSLAYIPFVLTQALGRPDMTAKRHVVELPFYVVILFFSTEYFGLNGAAAVWATWACIDMLFMFALARSLNRQLLIYAEALKIFPVAVFFVALAVIFEIIFKGLLIKGSLSALLLACLGFYFWMHLLDFNEKIVLRQLLKKALFFRI